MIARDRVTVLTRYPAMNIVQALSRIGGIFALLKLISIFLELSHERFFEVRLSSLNIKPIEYNRRLPTIVRESMLLGGPSAINESKNGKDKSQIDQS